MPNFTGVNAALWSFFERLSSQAVSFAIGIVLARLLNPYDYGVVGLTVIFITLSNVFIEAGFANALIRNVQRTERDLSTAFYFNVVVGVVAYALLWVASPWIARWFDEPLLVPLVRIAGLNVLLNSLCIVQTALLTSQLNIRLQTLINLAGQVPAGITAIFLAYRGFGVYALVLQTVMASAIRVSLLWIAAKWRPKERFDRESFSQLWNYGSKLLGANLIGTMFNQIYSVLIGKFIGKGELGYFSKATSLCCNVDGITNGIVQKVALPVLANYQTDARLLTEKFREVMRLLVMVLAPLSAFFCFASEDIVVLLWTEKWLRCALLFQVMIVGVMFGPIGSMSLSLMQTVGRTGMILKLELPKKLIYCLFLAVGFAYGIVGLAVAQLAINITGSMVNAWATKRILPYSYMRQLGDLVGYMSLAFATGGIISWCVDVDSVLLNITLKFVCIFTLYILVLVLMKDQILCKYVKRIFNH